MFAIALLFTLLSATPRQATIAPGAVDDYELTLRRGESAAVVVRQEGVDVVAELRGPGGALLDEVDGPTGRSGDEVVEVIAAEDGRYSLRVRPYDAKEPAGTYTIFLRDQRDAAATRRLLDDRAAARRRAAEWLRPGSAPLADGHSLDALASRARVVALGEATHGSRELGDARLTLTRRLVEQHGFRVITVEWSRDRVAALLRDPSTAAGTWMGRRTMRELVRWTREWNAAHPADPLRLIGVDAQDNADSRAALRDFVAAAYGGDFTARWAAAEKELAAADEQSAVFGDSNVDAGVRQFLVELRGRLALDAPLLAPKYGEAFAAAQRAAETLAQFADYNAGAPAGRTRDWYMAANVLAAAKDGRTIYWAHDAHVAARGNATGARLRAALGCGYAPVAVTFGQGAFIAQLPNDPGDRLQRSTLPPAPPESLESTLALLGDGPTLTTWPCGDARTAPPEWLRAPHAMHWVGGIWTPGSLPSAALRAFDVLHDFDGVVYLPEVTAEEIPADWPLVPARKR
jgi:erythromycin esterase